MPFINYQLVPSNLRSEESCNWAAAVGGQDKNDPPAVLGYVIVICLLRLLEEEEEGRGRVGTRRYGGIIREEQEGPL